MLAGGGAAVRSRMAIMVCHERFMATTGYYDNAAMTTPLHDEGRRHDNGQHRAGNQQRRHYASSLRYKAMAAPGEGCAWSTASASAGGADRRN